jgi:hypothetical protein
VATIVTLSDEFCDVQDASSGYAEKITASGDNVNAAV